MRQKGAAAGVRLQAAIIFVCTEKIKIKSNTKICNEGEVKRQDMGKKLTIFKDTQSHPTFLDPTTNSQGSMREEGGEKKQKGTKQKLERQRTERKLTATYTY